GGSVGLSYTPEDRYRATFQYEFRDNETMQHGLNAGLVGRLASGLTTLLRYRVANLGGDADGGRLHDGGVAFAVRPGSSDRGALLLSYAFVNGPGYEGRKLRTDRLSADGLLQLPAQFELYGRVSAVQQPDRNGRGRQLGRMAQGRLQRPLFWRFDAAGEARWIRE